jgi:hypothetical protein
LVVFQLADRRYEVEEVVWSSPPDLLDATLLTLRGEPLDVEPLRLASQWSGLSDVPPRALLIGHPGGSESRFSLKAGGDDERFSFQDALPTQADDTFLRYTTPRRGGSSGSAVFDPRDWSVVALHHSGRGGEDGGEAATYDNEAVPILTIRNAALGRHLPDRRAMAAGGEPELEGGSGPADAADRHDGDRRHDKKSAKPPSAAKPPDAAARFYFALEGTGARGRFVLYGADVDLIFNYAVPPAEGVIGTVEKGERLEQLRRTLTPLGVMVAPVGFAFRNEGDAGFRVMNFYDGGARSDKLRFELRAADVSASQPPPATGFHVIFEVRGSIIYQFFLPVRLVSGLPDAGSEEAELAPVSLDLDRINSYAEDAAADTRMMEAAVKEVLSNA